jgi:hypothetical protein
MSRIRQSPPVGDNTVAVDGVTITGDGSESNPLVAVGGGGGVSKSEAIAYAIALG